MMRGHFTAVVSGPIVNDMNFNFSCFVHNPALCFLQVWCPTVFASSGQSVLLNLVCSTLSYKVLKRGAMLQLFNIVHVRQYSSGLLRHLYVFTLPKSTEEDASQRTAFCPLIIHVWCCPCTQNDDSLSCLAMDAASAGVDATLNCCTVMPQSAISFLL